MAKLFNIGFKCIFKTVGRNLFRRATAGFGHVYYTTSNSAIYNLATFGYSKTFSGPQSSHNVLESLFGNPRTSNANISGTQYQIGFTSAYSKTYIYRRNLKWVNSFQLEYTSIPNLAVVSRHYSDVKELWSEYSSDFSDFFNLSITT